MKILIVDDEPLAREALTESLKKMDYDEILEAKDGIDAFGIILKDKPDIVLCDIRMPLLNGLDLQARIAEINKDIILIFISGYDLFEYAQKAIRQGAFDYLLKPVSHDALKNVLDRACQRQTKHKFQKDSQILMKMKLNQGLDFMRSLFIMELVSHKSNDRAFIDKNLDEYNIKFQYEAFRIIIISLDNFDQITCNLSVNDKDLLLFSIENISSEIFSELKIELYSFEIESSYGFLINYDGSSYHTPDFYDICLKIRNCINHYLNYNITIGMGSIVRNIELLYESFESAQEAVKQKIVKGSNQIHFYERSDNIKESSGIIGLQDEQEMLVHLEKCDIPASVKMLERIYASYKNSEVINTSKLMKLNLHIILLIFRVLNLMGINPEEVLGDEFLIYEAVNKCESIDDIIIFFQEKLKLCSCRINEVKDKWNNKLLEKAKEFIQDNFARNITLDEVADYIHLSPNYFSKLFKQEFGHNFIDYLLICKINKAKELIKANKYKANEICKMVGINDEKHFYKVFKKITGFTPKEYKNI